MTEGQDETVTTAGGKSSRKDEARPATVVDIRAFRRLAVEEEPEPAG